MKMDRERPTVYGDEWIGIEMLIKVTDVITLIYLRLSSVSKPLLVLTTY
jgi:hypothetical protein